MTNITNSLEENGFEVKDLIRWKKTNAMPRNRDRRFITDYEVAVWAVKKGGKWTFNRLNDKYEIPEVVGCLTPKSEKVNCWCQYKFPEKGKENSPPLGIINSRLFFYNPFNFSCRCFIL